MEMGLVLVLVPGICIYAIWAEIDNAECRIQTAFARLLFEITRAVSRWHPPNSFERSSLYWLRICVAIGVGPADRLRERQGEADQLVRILATIAVNTKRRMLTTVVVSAFCILNSALLISIEGLHSAF